MSGRVLCSTGTMIGRPNGRNHKLLAGFAPKLTSDGFEFMIYDTWYPRLREVISDVSSMGLIIPTVHCEKGIGELLTLGKAGEAEEYFARNCEAAAKLGAGLLVLHLWNGIPSDSNFALNVKEFLRFQEIARSMGLLLTVENVVCNHNDPMTRQRELLRYGASFTFDTKMAAFHGQLNGLFAPENSGILRNVRHLHINDYGGGYMDWKNLRTLHIGEGKIDFEEFFGKLPADYDGDFTIESTAFSSDGSVDLEKLNEDVAKVRAFIAKKSDKT